MRAVESLHGAAAAESCLSAMRAELAQGFRYQEILASGWYPIEWYRDLLRAIQTALNLGERALFEIGRECARQDMTGIYKLGFKLLSPEVVLQLSTRLFSNYYDTGKSKVVESRPGFAHVRWFDCAGFDKNMWWEAFGAAEMFMELAGARSVRTRIIRGGGDTDEMAELTMHWT
ncbi:MAG TPA: hypothetical protein VFQ61_21090 [Polyangiaceae bacterium]|nr:hypothetical protein [Polyangiaceae bacterium]